MFYFSDSTVRLWDICSGECVRLFSGHFKSVNDIEFTDDGRCLVSVSSDRTVRVFDIATSKCITVCDGHSGSVENVTLAYSVNRDAIIIEENSKNSTFGIGSFPLIVSSSTDNTIRFWNINHMHPEKSLMQTVPTNMRVSHLQMTKSNLVITAGVSLSTPICNS